MGESDIVERINRVREIIEEAQKELTLLIGDPSRQHSLVLTKMDEARLWAHEAIALQIRTQESP